MQTIRTLLVDGEPPAMGSLQGILSRDPEFEVVGTYSSGAAAVRGIETLCPDLVFLDVQIPGIDGLEVARRIAGPQPPALVFISAHARFAIDAFEVHALDYVLKPLCRARLLQSLWRAKVAVRGGAGRVLEDRRSTRAEARQAPPRYRERLIIREPGRAHIVMVAEIEWIQAAKNYVELHTERGTFLHRESMESIEQALDPRRFARIHRSTIVRIDRIREVITEGRSHRVASLVGGARLKVSATYAERLMADLHGE